MNHITRTHRLSVARAWEGEDSLAPFVHSWVEDGHVVRDQFKPVIETLERLAQLVADAEGAWIPCEERLPKVGEPFLIYLSKKNLVRQGFRTNGKLWFLDDGDPAPAVTHWRTLPAAPKPPEQP